LALVQAVDVVLVHPSTLLHHQVEDHPHDPATLDTELPLEQANWVELLQDAGVPQDCVAPLAATQEVPPLADEVVMVYVCDPFEHDPHDPTQFTVLLALQALAAVLVHPLTPLHHHVHGPVPLTAVGVPVAQVGVGVVAELNTLLQTQLIGQAALAILQAAVAHQLAPTHDQVCDHPHDPAEYPLGDPAVHVFDDHPQTPFTAQSGLALVQAVAVVLVPPPIPLHHQVLVQPHDAPV
jgi:hypothetical protein